MKSNIKKKSEPSISFLVYLRRCHYFINIFNSFWNLSSLSWSLCMRQRLRGHASSAISVSLYILGGGLVSRSSLTEGTDDDDFVVSYWKHRAFFRRCFCRCAFFFLTLLPPPPPRVTFSDGCDRLYRRWKSLFVCVPAGCMYEIHILSFTIRMWEDRKKKKKSTFSLY